MVCLVWCLVCTAVTDYGILPAWIAAVTVAAASNPAQYGWVSGSSQVYCVAFCSHVWVCGWLRAVSEWVSVGWW